MELRPFSKKGILSYKSGKEDDFIADLIVPLFEKISEVAGYYQNGPVKVEYLGKDRGRDIGIDVYWGYTDHFGREQHYGIQAKTKPIIKRSGPKVENSIKNIVNGCKEAFNKELTMSEIKSELEEAFVSELENPLTFLNKIRITGFYIITSQKTNQPAREYFLQQIQFFRNIQLFDCDDLYHLIKKLTKERYE